MISNSVECVVTDDDHIPTIASSPHLSGIHFDFSRNLCTKKYKYLDRFLVVHKFTIGIYI